ncbi:hypothetical protein [Caulobacter sp. LARHSG274]
MLMLMRLGNWIIGVCCALFVGVVLAPTGLYVGIWKLSSSDHAADWAQFFAAFVALGIAVGAPMLQHRAHSQREQADLWDKRRSAFGLLEQIVGLISQRQNFRIGEIEEMARMLDRIDFAILPPAAIPLLVDLMSRVTTAAKEVERRFIGNTASGLYDSDFNINEAVVLLGKFKEVLFEHH